MALGELDPINPGDDFQPQRLHANAEHPAAPQKEFSLEPRRIETRIADGCLNPRCVFRVDRHPDVNVRRGAHVAVKDDGVAADDQIINRVPVQ